MSAYINIPEIRVYSPSDNTNNGDNSNDQELKSIVASQNGNEKNTHESSGNNEIPWENTFHMRAYNLSNFPSQNGTYRASYRSQSVSITRARMGCTQSSAKSLNILRQVIQNSINKEIGDVMQKYLDKFFRPAVENIRNNNGINSVSEQHIHAICRQILEEAKKMYYGSTYTRSNSPVTTAAFPGPNAADNFSDNENNIPDNKSLTRKRLKDSDSDSEASSLNTLKPIVSRKKKIGAHKHANLGTHTGRVTPLKLQKACNLDSVKREGPKWDSTRLTVDTRFVLGSRANKALGFGTTRGRLYTKHADLFRYIGDHEDKQWLHDNHLMPPAGGRAYLLIKEDILDLIESNEYKNAPGVNANDMGVGFTVPENMIMKMRNIMDAMRNSDASRKKIESKSRIGALMQSSAPTPGSSATGDNSSPGSGVDHSNQPSVETNRPDSIGISPSDLEALSTTEMPSANPSPFSIGTACFDCDVSPNDNQEISPITSEISPSTLNDIQL